MDMHLATTLSEQNGLTPEAILATILYAFLGIILMVLFIAMIDRIFGFDVKKELMKDQNVAVGVVIAGFAVAVAIIIAGTIGS